MNREQKAVRTRFAPSPTGFLHMGGVRTALFAYLVTKQSDGEFILRIEDTDKAREVSESENHIFKSLKWLGLEWDEGPNKKGTLGPYRQSERLDIYKAWAQKLVDKGRAYPEPFSEPELEELRQKSRQAKKPFLYREYRPSNINKWDGSSALRFKSDPKPYKWTDAVLGRLSTGPQVIDDFIILKSDGYPTYNFAHVIDDHMMKISHVIRSQEFLASVPKYLNLYEALDFDRPLLATLPYVMAPGGKKKLSKRDGAKDILDYYELGYLPEAVINYLATLGWNDATDKEIYSMDDLVKNFSLDRVQKAGANFDEDRLRWLNGHYIRELSLDDLYIKSAAFWPVNAKKANVEYKKKILFILQDRLKHFSELSQLAEYFFEDPKTAVVTDLYKNPTDKLLKKQQLSHEDYNNLLKAAITELSGSNFTEPDIKNRLNGLLGLLKVKPALLFPVIRIAVSGSKSTPELAATLAVLGKDKSLKRLHKATANMEI